jgi:hypothetical protein
MKRRAFPLIRLDAAQCRRLKAGERIIVERVIVDETPRRIEVELTGEPAARTLNGTPADPPEAREFLPVSRKYR